MIRILSLLIPHVWLLKGGQAPWTIVLFCKKNWWRSKWCGRPFKVSQGAIHWCGSPKGEFYPLPVALSLEDGEIDQVSSLFDADEMPLNYVIILSTVKSCPAYILEQVSLFQDVPKHMCQGLCRVSAIIVWG